jgi:hypothetical protein
MTNALQPSRDFYLYSSVGATSLRFRSMYHVYLRLNGGVPIMQYYTIRLPHHIIKDSTKLYTLTPDPL